MNSKIRNSLMRVSNNTADDAVLGGNGNGKRVRYRLTQNLEGEVSGVTTGKRRGHKINTEYYTKVKGAIMESGGLMSEAARAMGIRHLTLEQYIKRHPELRGVIQEARSAFIDKAEMALRRLVDNNNLTAILFTLKCLGQDRGYIETPQRGKETDAPIIIKLMPATSDVRMPVLPKPQKISNVIDINSKRDEDGEVVEAVKVEAVDA